MKGREELDQLSEKYHELSRILESDSVSEYDQMIEKYPELLDIIGSNQYEDFHQIERFADFLADDKEALENEDYEIELWNHFLEVEEESENLDSMFPDEESEEGFDWTYGS